MRGERMHWARWLGLKRVLAVNVALFAVVGWGFSGEYLRNRDMQKEIDRLEGQAAALETRNLEIAELTRRLSSAEAVEREARLKLNLRRPGEEVVVVNAVGAHDEGPAPDAAAGTAPAPDPNPVKWWRYFFR